MLKWLQSRVTFQMLYNDCSLETEYMINVKVC